MEALVEGLWARLRNVLIALDRVDRLDTATSFVGWVETFQRDDAQIAETARAWVLRSVHLASDPVNYQILRVLRETREITIAQLMELTRLTRVELTERVKDLAQVGFVAQSLDTDAVQASRATDGLVEWFESAADRIAEHGRAGLTKDNPPPKFRRPIPNRPS